MRGFNLFLGVFMFVFLLGSVSAGSLEINEVNSTYYSIEVSGADDLYGYEAGLDYTGGAGDISFVSNSAKFLGSTGTTYGNRFSEGVFTQYGSIVNGTETGVSGSGTLFNVTFNGTAPTLRYLLEIDSSGRETYTYYNITAQEEDGDDGGGGGGGSGGSRSTANNTVSGGISIEPDIIEANVIAGREFIDYFTIINSGKSGAILKVSTFGLDGIVMIPSSIYLSPGEQKGFEVIFSSPENGTAVGKIVFSYNNVTLKEIPVIIGTRSEKYLFDVKLEIPEKYKEILSGDKLLFKLTLLEVLSGNKLDVNSIYKIKDFEGNVLMQQSETFFVENIKELSREINVNLKPGSYVLSAEIEYPGGFASSSGVFEVLDLKDAYYDKGIILIIGLAALVILLTLIIVVVRKREMTHKPAIVPKKNKPFSKH